MILTFSRFLASKYCYFARIFYEVNGEITPDIDNSF